jgi:hypothetical protein
MANISDAYGSMTLKGSWTPALIEKLNIIAQEIWAKWFYNTELDPFNPDAAPEERVSTFNGNGRWAYSSNLENLGRWTSEKIEKQSEFADVFAELIREMKANELVIEVDYFDEEAGLCVLYTESGEISSNGETFKYHESSYQDYDHNWENYMEVTGDEDIFYELVENLCTEIGISKNDEVEAWVKENTNPHCIEFKELDDERQAKFKAMFSAPSCIQKTAS